MHGFVALAQRPWAFSLIAVLFYAALLSPMLLAAGGDFSVFVVAGDRFVNAADLPAGLIVRPGSDGYDGAFYYRIALNPFNFAATAYGVTLDNVAWRFQRVGYPFLAWMVSLGRAEYLPVVLTALNLFGLGAIANLASRLARHATLPAWVPWTILLWPGFIVTLTHDATEVVAAAFLLAAFLSHLKGNTIACALLAACAMLTRETTAAACFGLFAAAALSPRPLRALPYLLAFGPFLAWRAALAFGAGQSAAAVGASNLDWPLVGAVEMLAAVASGAGSWGPTPLKDAVMRVFVIGGATGLIGFCGYVAARLGPVLRTPAHRGLAFAWIAATGVMSLLSAGGPWIDPTAYFRAFTECGVLGCVVLGLRGETTGGRWIAAAGAVFCVAMWGLCLIQLRL